MQQDDKDELDKHPALASTSTSNMMTSLGTAVWSGQWDLHGRSMDTTDAPIFRTGKLGPRG